MFVHIDACVQVRNKSLGLLWILISGARKCTTNETWAICWMMELGRNFGQLPCHYLSWLLNGTGILWKTRFLVVYFKNLFILPTELNKNWHIFKRLNSSKPEVVPKAVPEVLWFTGLVLFPEEFQEYHSQLSNNCLGALCTHTHKSFTA